LVFPRADERGELPPVPLVPGAHKHAAAGKGLEASRLASRRLRASDFAPALTEVPLCGGSVRRAAAALLFPLRKTDFAHLATLVCKPQTPNT